jgi:hypothetical protein
MTEALKKFAAATNNELFDSEYKGGEWMVNATETQETLEQWIESSALWKEHSPMKRGEIAGFPFIAWKTAQAVKGQARHPMSVIDFGDVRFAIEADLTVF